MKFILIWTFIVFAGHFSYSQVNFIRNGGFESPNRPVAPNQNHQLDKKCRKWKQIGNTTSDWFRDSGNYLHGAIDCNLVGGSTLHTTNSTNPNASVVPAHSGSGYAGIQKWPSNLGVPSEGIQQRIRQKLDVGIYELAFWYFLPCDTKYYAVEVYLGDHKNDLQLLILEDSLPRDSSFKWVYYEKQFAVPLEKDHSLDWLAFLDTGQDQSGTAGLIDAAYIYLDDFSLLVSDCDNCQAHGLISHNHNIPNVFSPDGDGIYDTLWIENINNVSYYEIEVFTRWGNSVYKEEGYNPNGFENHSVYWDGIQKNGQYFSYDQAWMTLHLENCGSSYDYLHSITLCNNAPPCNSYDWDTIPNYVPPLFGLETPPTHYRTLDIYGGPYYGNHHWYACDTIRIGGAGSHITPYFHAASGSTLKFSASDMVEIVMGDDVTIEAGADVELIVEPVACCAALRRGDFPGDSSQVPKLTKGETEAVAKPVSVSSQEQEQKPDVSYQTSLAVYPNPVQQSCNIRIELAQAGKLKVQLFNAQMHLVKTHLKDEFFQAGARGITVDYSALSRGMYFLRMEIEGESWTVKVLLL